MDVEQQRLTRIEDKLDTLSEAISKLAVVDARLTDFIAANTRTGTRLASTESLVSLLTNRVVSLEVKTILLTRVLWLVSSTVVVALTTALMKGVSL